jgi:hypothetical protein
MYPPKKWGRGRRRTHRRAAAPSNTDTRAAAPRNHMCERRRVSHAGSAYGGARRARSDANTTRRTRTNTTHRRRTATPPPLRAPPAHAAAHNNNTPLAALLPVAAGQVRADDAPLARPVALHQLNHHVILLGGPLAHDAASRVVVALHLHAQSRGASVTMTRRPPAHARGSRALPLAPAQPPSSALHLSGGVHPRES